jgi:hypothetical protein
LHQVVPHEVVGMANYTKNMLIGTGGKANIDLTHFIGAVSDLAPPPPRRLMWLRRCTAWSA